MKEIIVSSKRFGNKIIIVDDDFKSNSNWCLCGDGRYAVATIGRKRILMHRFIMKCAKGESVDHINGNGLDNRKCNLRICNQSSNTKNQRLSIKSKSGYKGVHIYKAYGMYMAQITVNYKKKFLGYFKNPIDAAKAYNEAAKKYFGEFARLNEIPCVD